MCFDFSSILDCVARQLFILSMNIVLLEMQCVSFSRKFGVEL